MARFAFLGKIGASIGGFLPKIGTALGSGFAKIGTAIKGISAWGGLKLAAIPAAGAAVFVSIREGVSTFTNAGSEIVKDAFGAVGVNLSDSQSNFAFTGILVAAVILVTFLLIRRRR